MTPITFLLEFLAMLLIGMLVISGFYIITRGEKSVQPDGKIRYTGKIFKQWSLFWEQTNGTHLVYYSGETLAEKYRVLVSYNSMLAAKLEVLDGQVLRIIREDSISYEDMFYIKEVLACEAGVKVSGSDQHIYLYLKEPIYYFPEWIRYPLSQCPPCMASVGGTLIYWPFILMLGSVYNWSIYPTMAYLFFWVVYMLALSALNKLAYKIIGA